MTATLTATMFNRTIVTEHATVAEARVRVLAIATAQQCTIEGDQLAGQFIPTTSRLGAEGTYRIDGGEVPAAKPAKITYVATAPDGTEFTRTSGRSYTHAVLIHTNKSWNNPDPHWGIVSFNSREELAKAEAARWAGHTRFDEGEIWDQAIVVEVTAR